MSTTHPSGHHSTAAAHHPAAPTNARARRSTRLRALAFGAVVVAVLGIGIVLATGDLLGQRGQSTVATATPVRLSMAGFDPSVIPAKAGQEVTLELWTTDAAAHLEGGVHTFISDELGIREELPAESRRTITFRAPDRAGDYDVYCDSCCGGKANPTMHATLRVEG